MSQDFPVTSYALLGLLTFGDELTGYELKQRADATLRFYWVSPATSQVYSELTRLTEHGLVAPRSRPDDGRDVTTYAITAEGRAALKTWMDETPTGFPVLKHPVLLRLLVGHVSEPDRIEEMLERYAEEAGQARAELAVVREGLRGSDAHGEPFHHASLVADWGLDHFAAERQSALRTLERLRAEQGASGRVVGRP